MPFQGIGTRISLLWHKDIWQASLLSDRSPRGRFYALLRVVSISATSFFETKTLSRAADLSFSSMLPLGPLIGIAMLVASTGLGERNPNLAADALNRAITFVAPQLNQYENPNNGGLQRLQERLPCGCRCRDVQSGIPLALLRNQPASAACAGPFENRPVDESRRARAGPGESRNPTPRAARPRQASRQNPSPAPHSAVSTADV